MKKKLLSILLTVCMALSLLPATALASGPSAAVYVGGVPMTDGTYLAVGAAETTATQPDVGYAYLDGGTLTLHDYAYAGKGYNGPFSSVVAIYTDGDLTLSLEGGSALTVTDTQQLGSVGVWADNLIISGNGSLSVMTGSAVSLSMGIRSDKALAIKGAATVTATGGAASGNYGQSSGVIGGGDVTISGTATVIATGSAARYRSMGLESSGALTVEGSATVVATGGAAGSESAGIRAITALALNGGVTVARAGAAKGSYSGTGRYAVSCHTSNAISLTDTKFAGAVGYNSGAEFGPLTDVTTGSDFVTGTRAGTAGCTATGLAVVPEGWGVSNDVLPLAEGYTYSASVNTAVVTAGKASAWGL